MEMQESTIGMVFTLSAMLNETGLLGLKKKRRPNHDGQHQGHLLPVNYRLQKGEEHTSLGKCADMTDYGA